MGGILHLSANGHLQQNSMKVFEKYYPGCNFMLATPPIAGDIPRIELPENMFKWLDYGDKKVYGEIEALCLERKVDRIILHSSFYKNVKLAEYLKSRFICTVYWLFWGYELYNALAEDFGVSFTDEKFNPFKIRTYYYPGKVKHLLRYIKYGYTFSDILRKTGEISDYFCFWNKYDYDLYVKYFGDKVKYKLFGYVCRERDAGEVETYEFPAKRPVVLINHQASLTGNHLTIMKKVKELDTDGKFDVCMPLSYGSSHIRNMCMKEGRKMFQDKFLPILDFLPREEYFSRIDAAQVAIFGQKRQEATGNIGRLLIMGTKVFMREDNPLYHYYKSKGYIVYSFEKDLNSIDSMDSLSKEEMVHNRMVWYRTRLYYDDFMPHFLD